MTTSANDRPDDERRLETSVDLYRDLSEALAARIGALKQTGGDADCTEAVVALKEHHRALQTVLEFEARLGRRNGTDPAGPSVELDLADARAEILTRLARWAAG